MKACRGAATAVLLGASLFLSSDPLFQDGDRWRVEGRDRDRESSREIRRDPVVRGQFRMYDKDGGLLGTWKKDPLFPDRYRFRKGP